MDYDYTIPKIYWDYTNPIGESLTNRGIFNEFRDHTREGVSKTDRRDGQISHQKFTLEDWSLDVIGDYELTIFFRESVFNQLVFCSWLGKKRRPNVTRAWPKNGLQPRRSSTQPYRFWGITNRLNNDWEIPWIVLPPVNQHNYGKSPCY